ncbi:uncharacterized protein LOC128867388 [Anastrepha ludens]|uniref:uncharacterized protein LOC128867388 n=1 Tax=Anastrepha ludens TaxID=28586 RepID=UPI0023AEC3B1|nr:uncharacterized protein LOC128867388 [Anastrepha ludens]
MQLLGLTLLMAVCLLGVYAIPNYNEPKPADISNNGAISLLVAQMRSALIDTRSLTPAESACATAYNNRTQQINNLMTTQTNECFDNANRTMGTNSKTANQTVASIRKNLKKVKQLLVNCTSITDLSEFLDYYTASFDHSIQLLDSANTQAHQMQAQIAANKSQVVVVRRACVSAAIGSGKTNLTQTVNDYQTCLSNISNQQTQDESVKLLD